LSFYKNNRGIGTLTIVIIIFIAAAVIVAGAFFSGTWPFGNTITRDEDFSDFTIVDIGSAFEAEITQSNSAEITQSNSYSIKITADENIMEHIQVSKTGETLSISIKPGILIQAVTLKADITMPELHELRFSGATHGIATGFSSPHNLTLTLSGASSLDPDISAGHAEISLSGASNLKGTLTASGDAKLIISGASTVELTGSAEDLEIGEGAGASHLDLSTFPVTNANVNLSGGSSATIKLDGRLDADISGASHLYYIGEPTMGNIVTSGGSTVSKQ
jgi:hypothetical protein